MYTRHDIGCRTLNWYHGYLGLVCAHVLSVPHLQQAHVMYLYQTERDTWWIEAVLIRRWLFIHWYLHVKMRRETCEEYILTHMHCVCRAHNAFPTQRKTFNCSLLSTCTENFLPVHVHHQMCCWTKWRYTLLSRGIPWSGALLGLESEPLS